MYSSLLIGRFSLIGRCFTIDPLRATVAYHYSSFANQTIPRILEPLRPADYTRVVSYLYTREGEGRKEEGGWRRDFRILEGFSILRLCAYTRV